MNKDIVKHKDVVRRLNHQLLHNTNRCDNEFTGTDVLIAGGYCSDLYHGVEPKDCDVWVKCDLKQYNEVSNQIAIDISHLLKNAGLTGDFKFHHVNYVEARELEGEGHHDDVRIMEDGFLSTVIVQASSTRNGVDLDMDFILLDHSHFEGDPIKDFNFSLVSNFDMDITRMFLTDYDFYQEIQLNYEAQFALNSNTVQVYANRDNRFFGKNNSARVRNGRIEKYMRKYKAFNYQYKIVE